ncbi:MAG: ribose-phosphate diphosphokinase [Acidobacteria bacterium]|nr:ribose-phosphate diphosphokinase [Acidobacteriota bacterium]
MSIADRKIKVFAGNACPDLAASIASAMGVHLSDSTVKQFADGEVNCHINENVRGVEVFFIQSTCRPVNDNLMELLIMIDAAKRASAHKITAVIPYFGYARQDKKDAPRVPISAKLVADLITAAGADRILAMDLHAGQIQGYFNIPVDHLFAAPVALDRLQQIEGDVVMVSPDAGGVERARAMAKRLNAGLAVIDKRRREANKVEGMTVVGDVEGATCCFYDDIVDTAGTLTKGAEAVLEQGAKEVYAFATHPVLSGPAIDRIEASAFNKLFVTDTIPLTPAAAACNKIEVLSVGPLMGEAIRSIYEETSISKLFV